MNDSTTMNQRFRTSFIAYKIIL